nr:uncharacterized protein LOC110366186 [Columba livia]
MDVPHPHRCVPSPQVYFIPTGVSHPHSLLMGAASLGLALLLRVLCCCRGCWVQVLPLSKHKIRAKKSTEGGQRQQSSRCVGGAGDLQPYCPAPAWSLSRSAQQCNAAQASVTLPRIKKDLDVCIPALHEHTRRFHLPFLRRVWRLHWEGGTQWLRVKLEHDREEMSQANQAGASWPCTQGSRSHRTLECSSYQSCQHILLNLAS